ncbi:MAG: GIY-YIG nuclease family protein [Candidatus Omnitrophica bacterium]|nr:GIY-YIG nuclease family protein [Candidatus Omnitrophota bacterium]
MMWHFYLLICSDNTIYSGISTDLLARLASHNQGKGAKYTRTRRPVRLAYFETLGTKSEALKREIEVKNFSREDKLQLIKHGLGQRLPLEKLRNL